MGVPMPRCMRRLLVIPIALLLLLAGAMYFSGFSGVKKRAEFSFINRGDIFTLDLNQMSYLQDFRLTFGIREGLFDLHPVTLKPIPAGAVSFDLSDDKKVWTFHLRKECKWSNGDPVTAQDYRFSWKRLLEEPGEYTYLFHYMTNAAEYEKSYARGEPIDFSKVGVEAVDDLTLRVTLENPVPYLVDLMAFPPFFPRHERSMAKFRLFTDTDVMDVFQEYVDAAHKLKAAGPSNDDVAPFSALVKPKSALNHEAVGKWLAFAGAFDPAQSTENQLLASLGLFQEMNPLEGIPAGEG